MSSIIDMIMLSPIPAASAAPGIAPPTGPLSTAPKAGANSIAIIATPCRQRGYL
jgi:hypothetical protein